MNKTKHFAVIFADILNFREVQELNRRAAGQSEKPLCALTKESVPPTAAVFGQRAIRPAIQPEHHVEVTDH